MKKLILMGLLAVFALGCSPTNVESDYEAEIQTIDKDEYENPRDTKTKGKNQS